MLVPLESLTVAYGSLVRLTHFLSWCELVHFCRQIVLVCAQHVLVRQVYLQTLNYSFSSWQVCCQYFLLFHLNLADLVKYWPYFWSKYQALLFLELFYQTKCQVIVFVSLYMEQHHNWGKNHVLMKIKAIFLGGIENLMSFSALLLFG